jgi:hypothetical protein
LFDITFGDQMGHFGSWQRAVVGVVVATLLASGGFVSSARAQTAPDRSEVVLVFDFSASILQDVANRSKFGAALERIADRVDATSSDLVAGDATVTVIQFAAKAIDYAGCADLKLLDSAATVARLSGCLRSVASAYRKGIDPALTRQIGIDTNYVAAMEQAAKHLPSDAVRPALILFTDGKHDVAGVPISQVQITHDRLFGSRSPFALLPVGMGLDPKERGALETGLVRLQIIRDMPPCTGGTAFVWPQVVFESPDEAGSAVAVALQDATCTFTVAPTPVPPPTPTATPGPIPAAVQRIRVTALDGGISLTWAPPATTPVPIVDYRIRCRAGNGDWLESTEGVSLETTTTIEGLTNGTEYRCEVATVGASSQGAWVAASTPATPVGRPAAPGKPSVTPLDRGVRISVVPEDKSLATGIHYECSSDNGGTWPGKVDATSVDKPVALMGGLTNGVDYVCRAFAENAIGLSDPSPLSEAVKPCGSMLDCNALVAPILGIIGLLLVGGIIALIVVFRRLRSRGYVVAVVDVVYTANLGHGSSLGIGFVRAPGNKRVMGIVADRGRDADIRIRLLGGGRFRVTDKVAHVAMDGESIVVADSLGARHELVLRAFDTKAASSETSRP